MYGQSQFSQSARYVGVSQYLPNCPPPPLPPPPQTANWYYPPVDSWSHGFPAVETVSQDPIAQALKKREANREFIDNFVGEFQDSSGSNEKSSSKVVKDTLNISAARDTLIRASRMIESLERLKKELENDDALSDEVWRQKQQECTMIEEEIGKLLDKFGNVDVIAENLVKRLNQRKNKRRREARRRARLRVEKSVAMEKRARRHDEVDAWIRDKRDTIERDKQVENLRKDADIVLSDVRGKRNDAKKFLILLQELRNLRRVKVNIARARGENLPLAGDQVFDNIIGQLVEQWSCLDREYSIEEQGLKLMLKIDNEQKIEKQKRSTFDDWERALFGKKLQSSDSKLANLHELLTIRHAWDKYANFEGDGSRIPIGWIMPVPPSSAAWQKCLKRE